MPGKILIVDGVATNRIVLKVKLAAAHYETVQASTGADAIRLARSIRPDLIVADTDLPDMSGIDLCARLKSCSQTQDIPLVMVSAFLDPDRRIDCLRAGAEEVFWKPLDELVLMARLRSLLRIGKTAEQLGFRENTYREFGFAEPVASYEGPALVGLIAGSVALAAEWKQGLQDHLPDRIEILDRDRTLSVSKDRDVPDVFVIAADMARSGDGLRFLSELRSHSATRDSAICLVVPPTARDASATALDLGANDLIDSEAPAGEMALRILGQIRKKRRADQLRNSLANDLRLAMIDPLTSLHNRRYAMSHLAQIAARAVESGGQYAVLLIDLDRFKKVNDTFGHAAGDTVLIEVAQRLKNNLRPSDMLARIGGEEFLVALPNAGFDMAHAAAERLRQAVGDTPVNLPKSKSIAVTLSIGLAMGGGLDERSTDIEEVIARADRALMTSKADGRNQVKVHQSAA
ncbi:MAG: diguanylate cyclase [Paracoccaceae bacterium]